jgi:hypothetical protein
MISTGFEGGVWCNKWLPAGLSLLAATYYEIYRKPFRKPWSFMPGMHKMDRDIFPLFSHCERRDL